MFIFSNFILVQLSEKGRKFSRALSKFVKERRIEFALELAKRKIKQEEESKHPLKDSDEEELSSEDEEAAFERHRTEKKVRARAEALSNSQFTVWTSMLKRSMQTAESFDPDEYDIKVTTRMELMHY